MQDPELTFCFMYNYVFGVRPVDLLWAIRAALIAVGSKVGPGMKGTRAMRMLGFESAFGVAERARSGKAA